MAEKKEPSWLAQNAGSIIGGISTIGGWLGIGEGRQDRRQIEQQTKLNDINAATSKDLANHEQMLKMKMWKDTNYGAQLAEAAKAGVSKAAAIGGSGTGTQGASVSGVGGGSAADAASTTNARTAQMQAGMQLASQLALQKAQKENIEADTANKQAEGTGKVIANEVAGTTKENSIQNIIENANKTMAEAKIKANEQTISDMTMKEQLSQVAEETLKKILENKSIRIENRKKEAETAIKEFEANMAKSGIAPNTPWWMKLLTDLADKHGLNILK